VKCFGITLLLTVLVALSAYALVNTGEVDVEEDVKVGVSEEVITSEEEIQGVEDGTDKFIELKSKMDVDEEGDIVSIGGKDIVVGPEEVIDGDIVGIGVDVSIDGSVKGDIVCIGGDIDIGDLAVVNGDVVSINGEMHVSDTAVIDGEKVNISGVAFLSPEVISNIVRFGASPLLKGFAQLSFVIVVIALWVLLSLGFISAFPEEYDKVKQNLENRFVRSSLIGISANIVLPLAVVVLVFSIVGIVLVPVLLVAWILGWMVGGSALGNTIADRIFVGIKGRRYLSPFIGICLISGLTIIGSVVALFGGAFETIGNVISLIGFIVLMLAFIFGIGSVLIALFEMRKKEGVEEVKK